MIPGAVGHNYSGDHYFGSPCFEKPSRSVSRNGNPVRSILLIRKWDGRAAK